MLPWLSGDDSFNSKWRLRLVLYSQNSYSTDIHTYVYVENNNYLTELTKNNIRIFLNKLQTETETKDINEINISVILDSRLNCVDLVSSFKFIWDIDDSEVSPQFSIGPVFSDCSNRMHQIEANVLNFIEANTTSEIYNKIKIAFINNSVHQDLQPSQGVIQIFNLG